MQVLEAPQQLVDEELDVLLCKGLFWKAAKGRLVDEKLDVLQARRWGCLRTHASKRHAAAQPPQRSSPPTAERLRRADDLVQVGVHDFVHHVHVPAVGELAKMGANNVNQQLKHAIGMEGSEARHVLACSHEAGA